MATNWTEESKELELNDYALVKYIGAGSFGVVYEATDSNGAKKAIKIVNGEDSGVAREVYAHGKNTISNSNILKCFNTWSEHINLLSDVWKSEINKVSNLFKDVRKIQIFEFELCAGDLKIVILRKNENNGWGHILNICIIQILHGLKYLHEDLRMIHRDLKPANILHDDHFNWKIGDLGTTRTLDDSMTPGVGTLIYAAPEIFDTGYTNKADIFSMGLIICEIVNNFRNNSLRRDGFEAMRNRIPFDFCQGLSQLVMDHSYNESMEAMTNKDPERRPEVGEVIRKYIGLSDILSDSKPIILHEDSDEMIIKSSRQTAIRIGGVDTARYEADRISRMSRSKYIVKSYRSWLEYGPNLNERFGGTKFCGNDIFEYLCEMELCSGTLKDYRMRIQSLNIDDHSSYLSDHQDIYRNLKRCLFDVAQGISYLKSIDYSCPIEQENILYTTGMKWKILLTSQTRKNYESARMISQFGLIILRCNYPSESWVDIIDNRRFNFFTSRHPTVKCADLFPRWEEAFRLMRDDDKTKRPDIDTIIKEYLSDGPA